jgi:crotonobetainyl-CoA:carnitine CoA-transferase CaiB-like acyl-CoA transferase
MKLEGLKVLDLSLFLPGPHLTMMMADHGADVIKVEPPGGEPVREVGLKQAGFSTWFRNTHRGKRCIQLDLKNADDKGLLLALADEADVLVEAFRPGVAARLGIDYATLAARNPRLVYCSISAFGQSGPKAGRPAHDLAIQADSGVVSLNLGQDGKPAQPHMPVADMAGSLMALAGILMALYRREKNGQGDCIDLSMQDALMAWLPNVVGPPFAEQRDPVVKDERSWGGNAMYHLYECADGRWLALGGAEHKFADTLFAAFGRPDLGRLCLLPPGPGQQPAREFLATTFAREPLAHWCAFLTPLDVCWAPVRSLTEAFGDPHTQARGMVFTDDSGGTHLGIPIRFLHEPGHIRTRLDVVGASTIQVRKRRAHTVD